MASLIDRLNPYLMIIFCMSKERANALGDVLGGMGYNVDVLTGELSQAKRKTVMKKVPRREAANTCCQRYCSPRA